MSSLRVVIPTKDRSGSVSLATLALALDLPAGTDLHIYDDGLRSCVTDYGMRFALDLATERGVKVQVRRGRALGIHVARSRILFDAADEYVRELFMVDDDVIVPAGGIQKLRERLGQPHKVLGSEELAQYVVGVAGLANNETGVIGSSSGGMPHQQRFERYSEDELHRYERMEGGAWTMCIGIAMGCVDAYDLARKLADGPGVAEDFVLTRGLVGLLDRSMLVWHCASPDQGSRDWDGRALAYLRKTLGGEE